MKVYRDFEIQISALGDARYALFVSGPGGDARATIGLPSAEPAYRALAERLARFETQENDLIGLGQLLFEALFHGPVKDVYTRSQSTLGPDEGLRLRLNIDLEREAEVAALPWEFLCDPDQGPLAMLDAPVVRYLPHQSIIPGLSAPLPLRILLSGAQTPPPAPIEAELAEVAAALQALGDNIQIVSEPHLTSAKLRARLREGFHVWHLIGHGGASRDGATSLLRFEDASGDTADISARELGILLQRSGLRLVVLNACNSGTLALDPFRSLAPALIRAQVPAVVAMQFSVPQEAARAFAGEFYRTLAAGLPVDMCVTEGRKAVLDVAGLGRPDWGIPVLYTRAPDSRLFDPPTAQPSPPPGSAIPAILARDDRIGLSAGAALHALGNLIQAAPEVQASAMRFRADFQVACEQIDLLGDYKDIHDQLHSLQIHCYNFVVQEARRALTDELAWDSLADYELTFQEIVSRLRELSLANRAAIATPAPGELARASLPEHELAWIGDLIQAHGELRQAIESTDAARLKRAARLMNRVLTVQPSQINARLNSAARTLRLPALVAALGSIRAQLRQPNSNPAELRQLEDGLAALAKLNASLSALVSSHDRWQAIDLELRRLETTLEQDLGELELSWPDLKSMLEPLYADRAESWAGAMSGDGERLEHALGAGEAAKIKQQFRRFRRQASDRFYRVDVDLKRTCDELRQLVVPLASVLRVIG